jgi:hypothetical protein
MIVSSSSVSRPPGTRRRKEERENKSCLQEALFKNKKKGI